MKRIALTIMMLVGMGLIGIAQHNDYIEDFHPTDTADYEGIRGGQSYYGKVHTPRGLLRALVIYVQFEPQGQGHGYNGTMANWEINSLPSNQEEFFYTHEGQFFPGDETKNISNFFYQHSNPNYPFMMVGETFPHLITIPVYPGDSTLSAFNLWYEFSHRAYQVIQANHSDFDWSRFDKRKNRISSGQYYQEDNSIEDPDNYLDYVIIRFRFWNDALKPKTDYGWLTKKTYFNGFAGIEDYTFTNSQNVSYTIKSGFTMAKGSSVETLFIHEFAHTLFDAGHQVGANKHFGDRFYMTNGYSFIHRLALHSINAWDRWWLDWSEITHDLTDDISQNGIYLIGDFVTTRESMRIKIPTPDNQYLWVENRTGETVWDNRRNPDNTVNGHTLPPAPSGAIMFVEALSADRENRVGSSKPNRIKFLYPNGNFDYGRSTDFIKGFQGWNRLYYFNHIAANPFGGHNDVSEIRDDYYTVLFDSDNNDLGCSTPDGIINYSTADGYRRNESYPVYNRDESFVFGNYGSELGFPTGKKVSISTNPGLIAQQKYSIADNKLDPIYLHGLSVEVLGYLGSGVSRKAMVNVKYDDFLVDRDVRWCGEIILREDVPLELAENKILRIDKSGTANRDTLTAEGDFINPTSLTFQPNATFTLREGSVMEVENGSTLTLESGSKLTLQEGAQLVIKSGSTLNIHDCAELEILPGAKLVVQGDNTLRIAPDAILKAHDGHGSFNIHRNAIIPPGFVHPNEVVPPTYRISENQQWSYSSYNMHLDLVVENGAKLKLKNTTLRFSKYAGIRVKYGAELETDFGELTRQEVSCTPHELWKGIVVEGNVFFVQNYRNQGGLRLDRTTISYASTGVEVKGGGIAKITRSTFHNNLTGVAFRAYRPNSNDGSGTQNMSYVDYSTFTHDAGILLPHLKPSVVYIDLNGVAEIDIAGNTFENLAPNAGALNSRGYGIKALNADVKLEEGNTFKNLFMGIQASATMGLPGFTVSDQTFENCFNGVRVSAYPMPVIQNSQFLVPYYNGSEGVPTAISIVNLNSFSVEGNSILGAYSGYGVYLENQLPCSGNVIGNSLEKLSVGISAEGSLVQGNMGANTVQVLCNQFNDNAVSDILVRGEGLAGIQGTPEVSASNQFGRSAMHLISEDVPLVYYGYPQSGYLPTEVNARVRVLESDELSDCSSRLVAGFGVVELTGVARAQSDMVETEQFIAEVQDMGNTQDVIGAIEELAHTNPLGLRNELLNRSPMLSDTVMVRSSSDETDLPHIMLAQVLMANPQSTKSHAVVTALEEKTNPLPYYLMDAILAEGSTLSPLDILRSTASSHRATRDYVAGALTHRFVSDTLGKAYESIQLIGDYHPSIMYQYLSAFAAYESAGSEDALLLLNQMGSSGELTPSQQQVLQGVISFITLMDTAGEELLNVESEEYAELVSIASGENGLASILADNLISYLETTPFFAEEYMVERSGTAAIPPLYGPYVEVSPYPVSQYVIISYGMGEVSYDVPLLRITDRAGKELHALELTYPQFEVLVEVDHWKPGLYTVSLLDGKSILAENTFVIEGVEHFDHDHKDKDDTAYPMISVYPNPTPGIIRIVVNGIEGSPFTYDVYNDLGVSLAKGRGVGEKEVDLSRFGTGSYMIIVGCEKQHYTISVMVK